LQGKFQHHGIMAVASWVYCGWAGLDWLKNSSRSVRVRVH
jgi:hypothetical protein